MSKRSTFVFAGACAIIAAVFVFSLRRGDEPVHRGRKLTDWVELSIFATNHQARSEAQIAIREVGTNAIPFLVRWLSFELEPRRKSMRAACQTLPFLRNYPRITGLLIAADRARRADGAENALGLLGPSALEATNSLFQLLVTPDSMPETKGRAARVLASIGHRNHVTLRLLLAALRYPSPDTRLAAAESLNRLSYSPWSSPEEDFAVEPVVASLSDTNPEVVSSCISALCAMRAPSKEVFPALTNLLTHPDANVRMRAQVAFGVLGNKQQEHLRTLRSSFRSKRWAEDTPVDPKF